MQNTKHNPTPQHRTNNPGPADATIVAQADFDDTIARNRALEVVRDEAIPMVPPAFRATDVDTRRRRLRRCADAQQSDARDALGEAAKLGEDLRADLGRHAPDAATATPMLARLAAIDRARLRAEALCAYLAELEEITWSDAVNFLEAEHREYQHAVEHEPGLALRYSLLARFFEARTAAVREGRVRALRDNQAPEAAPAEDESTTPR